MSVSARWLRSSVFGFATTIAPNGRLADVHRLRRRRGSVRCCSGRRELERQRLARGVPVDRARSAAAAGPASRPGTGRRADVEDAVAGRALERSARRRSAASAPRSSLDVCATASTYSSAIAVAPRGAARVTRLVVREVPEEPERDRASRRGPRATMPARKSAGSRKRSDREHAPGVPRRAPVLCASSRGRDLVADAPDGDDRRGVAELAAQLAHVHVDRARVAGEGVAPDALEQLVARQHEAAVVEQLPEQVELLRRELDLLARRRATSRRPASIAQVAVLDRLALAARAARASRGAGSTSRARRARAG